MRRADQYEVVLRGEPGQHILAYVAVYEMTPRRQLMIGAATMDALEDVWREVTGGTLDKTRVQHVRVHSHDVLVKAEQVYRNHDD